MGTNLGAGLQRTGRLRAPTRNRRQRTRLISGGPARSDDARPFFVFAVDPALKVAGAASYNTKSLLAQKIDHVGCAHATHCLSAEPSEYLRGCAGRRKQTDPRQRLKLRVAELGDARYIWCERIALERGDGKRLHLARSDMRQHAGNDGEHRLDVAGK